MIRRPPRSTHCISSAASDVYKRQIMESANPLEEPYLKLKSSDGRVFYVLERVARTSKTIRTMMESKGAMIEQSRNEISFPDIRSDVLEIVVEYFYYKLLNEGKENREEFKIPAQLGLDVLVASIYLQT
eukprot:TRINITY_DN6598_c0_g2_i1.p1 TRINITY_DN6598_c0_g2~~TRINITY_DN6598_c0_g2_i1.p1  ORF type:complete len:136 (-),score=48.32 TRINITY_DN6598_c0_g2_i1:74-460(-)